MRRLLPVLLALALFAAACHGNKSPTEPDDPSLLQHGRLSGTVTIGPNCSGTESASCPTPPEEYAKRKVLLYDQAHAHLIHTIDVDTRGFYTIELTPGSYVVDFKGASADTSTSVPKAITIVRGQALDVDIAIDTGLR